MKKTPVSFSLDLLRSYVAVVETASFTKAGDIVLRSQPTISDQIKRLELLFGVVILCRTARDVSMTPQGGVFFDYAKRLLSLSDEMAQALSADEPKEELRVGVSRTQC